MPKIIQLSSHVANLIAAGEVVERPASVVKELLENAVDAGASKITVEIRDGGMTFLRVTDDGCGMAAEDARTAFLRHATSKLRTAEDLAAIGTMGFRGEALAAIASVSRIDLLTKTAGAVSGTSLHLEAGLIASQEDAGCPEGTTIIIRDLFYNTPARMKFMKSDTVEGGRITAAVQLQALAHPQIAFQLLRDGKQVLSTPGSGDLQSAVYCVYGRACAQMAAVDSRWEQYSLSGFVSRPTDARPSRSLQTFFVNNRPVKSKLLTTALEEAYRNQIMVGKFPACVLHLHLPANVVDVNVHPAKTEVKFLSEKTVFDCVHYGVLGALNRTPDRPQLRFQSSPPSPTPVVPPREVPPARIPAEAPIASAIFRGAASPSGVSFQTLPKSAIPPSSEKHEDSTILREHTVIPQPVPPAAPPVNTPPAPHPSPARVSAPVPDLEDEIAQTALPMPAEIPWQLIGELYHTYIIVQQGDDAFLIDKHAAHERILFDRLKAQPQSIVSQSLLAPLPCRLSADATAELLANLSLLAELGFEIDEFGENTVLLRQIPMDLNEQDAIDALEQLAADLLTGRQEDPAALRDEMLHTVACKAAIKAGWINDEKELLAIVKQVMAREDLKYCPHGRPICITLSRKQLEKQFKRT